MFKSKYMYGLLSILLSINEICKKMRIRKATKNVQDVLPVNDRLLFERGIQTGVTKFINSQNSAKGEANMLHRIVTIVELIFYHLDLED